MRGVRTFFRRLFVVLVLERTGVRELLDIGIFRILVPCAEAGRRIELVFFHILDVEIEIFVLVVQILFHRLGTGDLVDGHVAQHDSEVRGTLDGFFVSVVEASGSRVHGQRIAVLVVQQLLLECAVAGGEGQGVRLFVRAAGGRRSARDEGRGVLGVR